MDEIRTIIPAAEAAHLDALSQREKDAAFLPQWKNPEDFPACPMGIALLREFAEAHPALYVDFVARNPTGHQCVPALARNAKWVAYRVHWGDVRRLYGGLNVRDAKAVIQEAAERTEEIIDSLGKELTKRGVADPAYVRIHGAQLQLVWAVQKCVNSSGTTNQLTR